MQPRQPLRIVSLAWAAGLFSPGQSFILKRIFYAKTQTVPYF